MNETFIKANKVVTKLSFLVFPAASFAVCPLFRCFYVCDVMCRDLVMFLNVACLLGNIIGVSGGSFVSCMVFYSMLGVLTVVIGSVPVCVRMSGIPASKCGCPCPCCAGFVFLGETKGVPIGVLYSVSSGMPIVFAVLVFVVYVFKACFLV